ncbi:MAG TPA: mycofactocin system FadH/OYE family oxidoreductase 2 [Pseudonocardia sp.]|nr:mycofactocin system FadH/OYE family oxidoreductase 2 [Pseudonocardia sp.]
MLGRGPLFSPLRVGPLRLTNRIVFCAHLTNQAADGLPTPAHAAYYAARAAGGAGLVITEEHGCDPADRPYEKLIDAADRRVIGPARAVVDAVHAHGVPILAQLNHNGGQSNGRLSRRPVRAASPVPDPMFREVPVALTEREIAGLVAGFARTAGHCAAAGYDGVELQCSHSSIVRGFLSPLTNRRADGYGGPLVNRARILLEIVEAVRAALGPDRALGVRLCGDEGLPGGFGLDEAVVVAQLLAATGRVDYLNTAIGVATSTLYLIEASLRFPPGYALPIAAALRRAVDLPVIGVGRFTDPTDAERALAEGHCDLVGVVRGQIADPEFAAKARAGRPVRACVGCNQECVGQVGRNRWLGCTVNPRAGREALPLPTPGPAKRVLVVGAGPAGLRAAATAAGRGHRVLLGERADEPGGQVRLAAAGPGRAEFGHLVRDLLVEARAAGVRLRTGVEVDAALIEREDPDAVVLATGSRGVLPPWADPSAGVPRRVWDVREVMSGAVRPSGSVLVYDELGFQQAPAVAELLAEAGGRVEIMTPGLVVAPDLGTTLDMELFHRRAASAGITLTPESVVTAAATDPDGVTVTVLAHLAGVESRRRYDGVVCVLPPEPDDALWSALSGRSDLVVHRIGDCLAPRRVPAPIVDGHRVGVSL